ncbi:hypothetical protein ACVW0P_000480 [Mucilaginibacter sp. UYNi724]
MKRTVKNKQADIQQIQKYLNGELDARAMHKLERRAQDDPFLMEALEGYGAIKADQRNNITGLQQRLEARTATKVMRMTPWMVTAIAAGVIGFAVVIGLLYNNDSSDKQIPQIAMNQPAKATPTDTAPVIIDKQAEQVITSRQKQTIASNNISPNINKKVFADKNAKTTVTMNGTAPVQQDILKEVPTISPLEEMVGSDIVAGKKQDTLLGGGFFAINKTATAPTVLTSKAEGASMTTRPGKAADNNPSALASAGLPPNLMAGAVIDKKDALPLPDAAGRTSAKPASATEGNAYGYTSPNAKKDAGLLANNTSIGTKSFRGRDSATDQFKNSSALNEVVIANNNYDKNAKARPLAGWDNYKKYLQQGAVNLDGKEGAVELKATINPNGTVTAITVNKSLSTTADAKAISLIQNGPAWIGNASGKAEDVRVKVVFHK